VARFGLWAGELAYAEALLHADVRNNSAWAQRWFVVAGMPAQCAPGRSPRCLGQTRRRLAHPARHLARFLPCKHHLSCVLIERLFQGSSTAPAGPHGASAAAPREHARSAASRARRDMADVFEREVAFAAAQIRRAPHNDSAWAYLRGLPALPGQAAQLAYAPGIAAACLEVRRRRTEPNWNSMQPSAVAERSFQLGERFGILSFVLAWRNAMRYARVSTYRLLMLPSPEGGACSLGASRSSAV
jgi:hypothetical protein